MLDKGATTFSKPTLSLMTHSIMTLGIVDLIVTLSIGNTKHNYIRNKH
jgi:hypothetical protein